MSPVKGLESGVKIKSLRSKVESRKQKLKPNIAAKERKERKDKQQTGPRGTRGKISRKWTRIYADQA